MKYYWTQLEWKDFKTLDGSIKITELDRFADYSFKNGISIRISTGELAHTNNAFPYEMNILYPNGHREMIPKLSLNNLNIYMNKLDSEIFPTFE